VSGSNSKDAGRDGVERAVAAGGTEVGEEGAAGAAEVGEEPTDLENPALTSFFTLSAKAL